METKWQIVKEEDGTYTLQILAGTLQKPEWMNYHGPHQTLEQVYARIGEPKFGESYVIDFYNACDA